MNETNESYYERNKEKIKARSRKYYLDNKTKCNQYYVDHKEYFRIKKQEFDRRNPDYNSIYSKQNRVVLNEKLKDKIGRNPHLKIRTKLTSRVAAIIRNKVTTEKLIKTTLSCSISEFRIHLESKFTDGMTWENYGNVWEIDHIMPCSKFNLTDEKQQTICYHYTNLQPLLKAMNRWKKAKILPQPYDGKYQIYMALKK